MIPTATTFFLVSIIVVVISMIITAGNVVVGQNFITFVEFSKIFSTWVFRDLVISKCSRKIEWMQVRAKPVRFGTISFLGPPFLFSSSVLTVNISGMIIFLSMEIIFARGNWTRSLFHQFPDFLKSDSAAIKLSTTLLFSGFLGCCHNTEFFYGEFNLGKPWRTWCGTVLLWPFQYS